MIVIPTVPGAVPAVPAVVPAVPVPFGNPQLG
ncbi:unnamed protein product [Strongylus vulgaris]|uniref:Uncharacterized protein n=1 Tax=Strongylus vulgaris TaxID=40348 RepID=A0A3P7KBM9_STRVU|nr:unnamed protein product [Strongylus vulgaris]